MHLDLIISFYKILQFDDRKRCKTERQDKDGEHWWSILDLHLKKGILLLFVNFVSFGLKVLKTFIIQDDKKIIDKILFRLEEFKQANNKLTLAETNFSRAEYEKIAKNELGKLSIAARDLFHFFNEFRKPHNVRD